tara:strand:+ start:6767 stop:7444 length:678 start_codon:yes stop_codon:yes gene_type:complete
MPSLYKTKILTSIKSLSEINLVLKKKVDIIDFKDPASGSLGDLPTKKINFFLKYIPSTQLTSATIGDIKDLEEIKKKTIMLSKTKVDFIKIGFFFNENKIKSLVNLKKLAKKKIIAVLFADNKPNLKVIKEIKKIKFDGILIDTENKKNGNLRNYLSKNRIKNFINASKKQNLSIGLAGSLNIKDINPLIELGPDYLGFRGAMCEKNKRKENISEALLDRLISKF